MADADFFWPALERELWRWQASGAHATFWWRDDDATAACPAIERLVEISVDADAPVTLAVVPKTLAPDLPRILKHHRAVRVLQHGFSHRNHATDPNDGAWELGVHREAVSVIDELKRGRDILHAAFFDQFIPVISPPWNRINRNLLPELRESGFIGLSGFGERRTSLSTADFIEAHAHFDLISWKGRPRFGGQAAAQRDIIGHLRRRRLGIAGSDEATGILSHHLSLDEDGWQFLARLVQSVRRHPGACWLSADDVFQISGESICAGKLGQHRRLI